METGRTYSTRIFTFADGMKIPVSLDDYHWHYYDQFVSEMPQPGKSSAAELREFWRKTAKEYSQEQKLEPLAALIHVIAFWIQESIAAHETIQA